MPPSTPNTRPSSTLRRTARSRSRDGFEARAAFKAVSAYHFLARILRGLGRRSEALLIARHTAEAMAYNPDLGPKSIDSLVSHDQLARLLNDLGHGEEALSVTQRVLNAEMEHPDLGPHHPFTLAI